LDLGCAKTSYKGLRYGWWKEILWGFHGANTKKSIKIFLIHCVLPLPNFVSSWLPFALDVLLLDGG